MKLFLRISEIAEMFGCSEKAALAIIGKFDLKPWDFGKGRGNGLAWYAPAITQLAADMHERAQEQKTASKSAKGKKQSFSDMHPVTGKGIKELKLLLQATQGPVQ